MISELLNRVGRERRWALGKIPTPVLDCGPTAYRAGLHAPENQLRGAERDQKLIVPFERVRNCRFQKLARTRAFFRRKVDVAVRCREATAINVDAEVAVVQQAQHVHRIIGAVEFKGLDAAAWSRHLPDPIERWIRIRVGTSARGQARNRQ